MNQKKFQLPGEKCNNNNLRCLRGKFKDVGQCINGICSGRKLNDICKTHQDCQIGLFCNNEKHKCEELKKIPSVIFHSFPGTFREADSLKKHGINAFFSFGKPILNGKKSAIECVEKLPLQNLLFETDAPYQTLKGEKETLPGDIKKVYQRACELRKISLEEMTESILENFMRAYFQS